MVEKSKQPLEVFYSYASEDENFRQRLEIQMKGLKRQKVIDDWHFRKIGAGKDWKHEIHEHLEGSRIILLLISPYFIASDYCYDIELGRAIEKHNAGTARAIPIVLRPTDNWKSTPFGGLQALPTNGKPINKWSNKDEAWADVTRGIREAAEELQSIPSSGNMLIPSYIKHGIHLKGIVIPSHCNYSDISLTDDYYYAVQHLCAIGAVTGYADGTFRPESKMTRGQFAKIISNTLEFTGDSGGQIFEDVPPSNTFFEWINRLAERNIVRGYACGTVGSEPCVPSSNKPYFRPFDDLTREQLCEIIVRAGVWPTNSTGGPHFKDVPLSSPFFQYVETAYNNDIISPFEDGSFGFGSPATRGQICFAVYKGIAINERHKNTRSKLTGG